MYHCFPILMKIVKGCLGKYFLQNITATKKKKMEKGREKRKGKEGKG